jgi:putative transposase
MPLPRRINIDNNCYFITTKTFENKLIFSDKWAKDLFIEVVDECRKKYQFPFNGYAIMPDHVHLLIIPKEGYKISNIIQKVKSIFAGKYKSRVAASLARGERISASKTVAYAEINKYGYPVWQKSFYDHLIRNKLDFEEKLNYIHKNCLKHGLVDDIENWAYSSWHNYNCDHKKLIEIDFIEW